MAEVPGVLLRHTVDVETFTSTGSYGDAYEPPVTVRCWRDETRRLVRNTDGDQVVSEATLVMRMRDGERFTPGSNVTLRPGDTRSVISTAMQDDGGLGAWQHASVTLE